MKTRLTAIRDHFSVTSILFAGVAIAFAGMGIQQLKVSAHFADYTQLLEIIKPTDRDAAKMIAEFASKSDEIVAGDICRSDIVKAGLNFNLANLDRQNSVRDFEAWSAAVTRADRYIVHALKCSPGDGNLWARLAMVRWTAGENPQELAAILGQSTLLAPAEMDSLQARFVVWRKVGTDTLDQANSRLDADLRILLLYADIKVVREILTKASSSLKPRIAAILQIVPQGRLEFFKRMKIDLAAFSS